VFGTPFAEQTALEFEAAMRFRPVLPLSPTDGSTVRWAFIAVCGLTILRFILAAWLPLAFDEAYFWLWSKHLAISYYDHPPLIALTIRAGTFLFGDTEFGVRFVSLLASVGASWAVWRSGALLLGDERSGALACLFFNLTLMFAAESMSATPDALILAASSFVLFTLAKAETTHDGRWWLGVGLSAGVALFSKYTAFFLGLGIALWLIATPQGRAWLRTIWPYAAGILALAFLVPNLVWNAQHDWISFKFQFGRISEGGQPAWRFVLEFVGSQIGLASPFILVLSAMSFARESRFLRNVRPLAYCAASVWPALLYFAVHSLHSRVQGNWPSFLYPSLAVLAAGAVRIPWKSRFAQRSANLSQVLAVPAAAVILLFIYAQAFFVVVPMGRHDPIARMMGVGFNGVAQEISALAKARHATALVTTNYVLTGWLSFYLHRQIPVIQLNEDFRWLSSPRASLADLQQAGLLYVTQEPGKEMQFLGGNFSGVGKIAQFERMRGKTPIDPVYVYALSGYHGPVAGRLP
jgi:4-amino-4-deoxy-L-arabinose transferase-like glycosyltransferase